MPFNPLLMGHKLTDELNEFIKNKELANLYKKYSWKNDNYNDGFPDILKLEQQLKLSDATIGISHDDVVAVANWGCLPNIAGIKTKCPALPANTLRDMNNTKLGVIYKDPLGPMKQLEKGIISGIGPTYSSKVLRFGLAEEYGAIDTRIARVFGNGDEKSQQHSWLDIEAVKGNNGRWSIPSNQKSWPVGYKIWVNILRYISANTEEECPHPSQFIDLGLRNKNKWFCADVEMALFSYASKFV